jgi:integrase
MSRPAPAAAQAARRNLRPEMVRRRFQSSHRTRSPEQVRQPRTIPLNATTQTLLEGLPKTSEYVFPGPKTERRVNDVGRQFERAVKNAKLVDFHFHDLRHTAATRMADAGADPFTLAAILGHSDIRMTARYTHATDEAKRRAVDNLVKPESNSDPSEPEYQQLKAVENSLVASGSESFGNGLAPEIKTAEPSLCGSS